MANTTNLGLGKLAGTEKLKTFPNMQADNMDTLDTAIGAGFGKNSKPSISQSMKNLGGGMAVLCDNNTHAAIPAGHYAYVMNHGTLTEGLYQNLSGSQIAANATLSGSNLTAVSGGGLNSLYSKITSDSGLQYIRLDGNNSYIMYRKIGNVVSIYLYHKISSATIAAWANLFFSTSFPSEYRPKVDMVARCVADRSGSEGCAFFVNSNGNIYIAGRYTGASDTNDILQASVSYGV